MKRMHKAILIFSILSFTLYSQEDIGKGRLSGLIFGDYYYNLQRDSNAASMNNVALPGAEKMNAFQIRRIYLTYDHDISAEFSGRIRLEAENATTVNNKFGVFLKDAYIKWSEIFPGSDLVLGLQPPPVYGISESYWENRFLEKTQLDLRKISPSSDLGISLRGNLWGNGILKYWLMFGNGNGNSPETDKHKRAYSHLQFSPDKRFTFTFSFDYVSKPALLIRTPGPTDLEYPNDDFNFTLFAGYREKQRVSAGIEAFYGIRQNGEQQRNLEGHSYSAALSLFGTWYFSPKMAVAARYDYFDPLTSQDGDSRNLFLFAVNWYPAVGVIFSSNIVIESYESLPNGTSFKTAITPRLTFYYAMN
ncbi:MAG: hypothetical protein J0L60_03775 [Ignavibacteria bacterium]|nr:hypothetical protein [Ignavibacteria bacterium]